jgi:hypothetical protein
VRGPVLPRWTFRRLWIVLSQSAAGVCDRTRCRADGRAHCRTAPACHGAGTTGELRAGDDLPHPISVCSGDVVQADVRGRSLHGLHPRMHGTGDQLRAAGGERAGHAVSRRLLDQIRADAARRRSGADAWLSSGDGPGRGRSERVAEPVRVARADHAAGMGFRRRRHPAADPSGADEHRRPDAAPGLRAPGCRSAAAHAAADLPAADRAAGWHLCGSRAGPHATPAHDPARSSADAVAQADSGTAAHGTRAGRWCRWSHDDAPHLRGASRSEPTCPHVRSGPGRRGPRGAEPDAGQQPGAGREWDRFGQRERVGPRRDAGRAGNRAGRPTAYPTAYPTAALPGRLQ